MLNPKVNVDMVGVSKVRYGIISKSFSHKWLISPESANRTVQNTTQRGIRTILHPSLSRQFKTTDRSLRYNRLQQNVFTNTMQACTVSRNMNQYAHVYLIEFVWSRAHPMKKKVNGHETLSLFFNRDGVSPKTVMDGSKDQTLG